MGLTLKGTRCTMRISAGVSSKPQLLEGFPFESSDLDTSDDFSAELDRSHGFFTASGEVWGGVGGRSREDTV